MKLLTQSKFWVGLTVLSLLTAYFSYEYSHLAYPLINVAITADDQQVIEQARVVAADLQWDLADYRHVATFESKDDLQCFVELEAGGKQAFEDIFKSGYYYPYHWHVRFFQPQNVVEMQIWFAPDGKQLGFNKTVSQLTPGAALEQAQAEQLVLVQIGDWCPNFAQYKLIEYEHQKRDSGRIDHAFIYERQDLTIGKGFYRFHAVVSGDVVTALYPSIKVPDNFVRRYQQMRSANNLLAAVGAFFFRSLYLLFFTLIGLIFFYRRNYLQFRSCALAAFVIAGGMFVHGMNDYPLWWVSYNTVQSTSTFVLMKLFMQAISFLYLFGMLFAILLVAQAAGRYAYKHHIQFFALLSEPALGSWQIGQQVLLGYLLVPFMFFYEIAFGYFTNTYLHWWAPAGRLSDPNILVSYAPWFQAVMQALQAGFFEEILCRALPLAMVAVLTQVSKRKNFWSITIFVLQAFIFGALHANYPNQPFYTRVVELILPSFAFGWLYLQLGLLPGIITHYTYDAILFALPIFVSNLFWTKVFIVILIGLPLLVVLYYYLRQAGWHNLPASYFNHAQLQEQVVETGVVQRPLASVIPNRNQNSMLLLGCVGLFAWAFTYKFTPDSCHLPLTKAQAIQTARQEITHSFAAQLDGKWTALALVQDDCSSTESRFIWQLYGSDIYNLACKLSYLSGVNWLVRFVQFTGEVEERGQEYTFVLNEFDRVIKATHQLPEHFAGADISQEQALALAYDFIAQHYLLEQQDLNLIAVNSDKFDNRRDWEIVVQDQDIFDFTLGGQARIKVKIAGDQISHYEKFIFVPEDWKRADQAKMMNVKLFKTGLWFLIFLILLVGSVLGIKLLLQSRLGLKMMRQKGLFVAVVSLIYAINSLLVFVASFSTIEPFYDQLTRMSLGLVTQISYQVLFCSVVLAIGAVGLIRGIHLSFARSLLVSLACAGNFMGISALFAVVDAYMQPVCGNYSPAAHGLSWLAFAGDYIKTFYLMLSVFIALLVILKCIKDYLPRQSWLQPLIIILCCLGLESLQMSGSILWMLGHGFMVGCTVFGIYILILRYDTTLLPLMFGAVVISKIVPELIYPCYVGARLDACVAIILVAAVALFFYERAHQE